MAGMCHGVGFGWGKEREQRRRYRDYVETAAGEGRERSPWELVKEQAVLGSAEFLAELKQPMGEWH
jgi:hypothetical protein